MKCPISISFYHSGTFEEVSGLILGYFWEIFLGYFRDHFGKFFSGICEFVCYDFRILIEGNISSINLYLYRHRPIIETRKI